MVTRKKKRNRQRSTQKGKTTTAYSTPPDVSRDGLDINNRATAPNNPSDMKENFMDATTPTAEADYTTPPAAINSIAVQNATVSQAVEVQDEGATSRTPLESVTPITSSGLPDKVTGHSKEAGDGTPGMFAPENLRASQDFVEQSSVETIHGVIPVRKPNKQEFFRVRHGEEWQLPVAVIENSEDRELWVVVPGLVTSVNEEVTYVLLRLAVNRHGVPFLWALKQSKDGKTNLWNQSAMAAADAATTRWIRMKSNLAAGRYDIIAAKRDTAEPEYPDLSFQEILELAFKDRIISSYDHPFLRQLRGEI